MRTTTIRATPIRSVSCGPESGQTVFTLAAVVGAYRACRRRKRATRNAQRYEMGLLDHLVDTAQALSGRVWRPSRAVAFVVRRPKAREILAADFADRVVHHLLVPRLERQFEPVFIHDCFSNRRGKGTHGAVDRLQTFMRRAHAQAVRQHMRLHYLQLDVANFFNSINRRCLFGLVRERFARDQRRPLADPRHLSQSDSDELLGLTRQLLTGNAATGVRSAALSVGRHDWQFPADSRALFSMLASYLGHFRHASSQRLVASLWTRYPWLAWVVRRSANGRLLPTQSAPGVTSMRGQWRYFKKRFAPACVLMQVGHRVEMYGTDARRLAQWPNHGGTVVAKIGWSQDEAGLSWPLARCRGLLQRLSQAGLAWVYVDEQGWLKGGLKQRALRRLHWAPQLSPADLQAANQSQHQQHQHQHSAMKAVHLGAKP